MQETCRGPKLHELAPYMRPRDNPGDNDSLVQPGHDKEKGTVNFESMLYTLLIGQGIGLVGSALL